MPAMETTWCAYIVAKMPRSAKAWWSLAVSQAAKDSGKGDVEVAVGRQIMAQHHWPLL